MAGVRRPGWGRMGLSSGRARWREDGFASTAFEDHVSIAGDFPRAALEAYVQSSFESLKREQAHLIAQIQQPRSALARSGVSGRPRRRRVRPRPPEPT